MTVRAGREFLAVPGPTNIPDEVLQAMHRPAVEIYSEPLIALTDGLLRDLGKVFATATRPYIYIANGHGAWEAALTNVLSRGDKILVLESGQFAIAWGDAAARLGVEVEVLEGRLAARRAAGRCRSPPARRQGRRDQGDPRRADRDHYRRRQRYRGDRRRHQSRPARRALCGRRRRFARLRAVCDGCLGRRRRGFGIAERPDVAAGLELRRRRRARPRRPPQGRFAHALLGLDDARRRVALSEIRRHAAGAIAVRAAQGPRHAVRGRARQRLPAPPAARRGRAPRRRGVEDRQRDRFQCRRSGRLAPMRSPPC